MLLDQFNQWFQDVVEPFVVQFIPLILMLILIMIGLLIAWTIVVMIWGGIETFIEWKKKKHIRP